MPARRAALRKQAREEDRGRTRHASPSRRASPRCAVLRRGGQRKSAGARRRQSHREEETTRIYRDSEGGRAARRLADRRSRRASTSAIRSPASTYVLDPNEGRAVERVVMMVPAGVHSAATYSAAGQLREARERRDGEGRARASTKAEAEAKRRRGSRAAQWRRRGASGGGRGSRPAAVASVAPAGRPCLR